MIKYNSGKPLVFCNSCGTVIKRATLDELEGKVRVVELCIRCLRQGYGYEG